MRWKQQYLQPVVGYNPTSVSHHSLKATLLLHSINKNNKGEITIKHFQTILNYATFTRYRHHYATHLLQLVVWEDVGGFLVASRISKYALETRAARPHYSERTGVHHQTGTLIPSTLTYKKRRGVEGRKKGTSQAQRSTAHQQMVTCN